MSCAGERAIYRQLRASWKQVTQAVGDYDGVLAKTATLDAILNQMEQRECVLAASVDEMTVVRTLPDFRQRLIAKIDDEVTDLCADVRADLKQLEAYVALIHSSYLRAVSTWQKYHAEPSAILPPSGLVLGDSDIKVANEDAGASGTPPTGKSPSSDEIGRLALPTTEKLYALLDEIYLHYATDVEEKRRLLDDFSPTSVDSVMALRRHWCARFAWSSHYERHVLPYVLALPNTF